MIGRMFQRRGNQLVEVTNPSVILADTSNLVQGSTAPVYVNADTGDDVNDGMTANTAVKTINRALALSVSRGSSELTNDIVVIYIAQGTYNENVYVRGRIALRAQGNVTIEGVLGVHTHSMCALDGPGAFTINGVLEAIQNSFMYTDTTIIVNGRIAISTNSILEMQQNDDQTASLTVNYAQINNVDGHWIFASSNSGIHINIPTTLTGYGAYDISSCVVAEKSTIGIHNSLTINATDVREFMTSYLNSTIIVSHRASLSFNGSCIRATIDVHDNSVLSIDPSISVTGNVTGPLRYNVYRIGSLLVYGAGANRIPGNQQGYDNPNQAGFYL